MPVFAGEISEVITRLGDTKARINTRDLSVRSRQKVIENFGIEITRRITDFEGAALDYDALDSVFYFPIWGLPISRNSVSLIVHGSDGNDIDINIVDAIATEGMLSNRNAEIDYARGLIRFEAPPDDADCIHKSPPLGKAIFAINALTSLYGKYSRTPASKTHCKSQMIPMPGLLSSRHFSGIPQMMCSPPTVDRILRNMVSRAG